MIDILLNDNEFKDIEREYKNIFKQKIIEAVEGDLIESEVLNTCLEIKPHDVEVTQITDDGEWDMVIAKNDYMDIYEIKRSKEINEKQYRWLINDEMAERYNKYGIGKRIRNRYVLYRGEDKDINISGKIIQYRNVENFLLNVDENNIV